MSSGSKWVNTENRQAMSKAADRTGNRTASPVTAPSGL